MTVGSTLWCQNEGQKKGGHAKIYGSSGTTQHRETKKCRVNKNQSKKGMCAPECTQNKRGRWTISCVNRKKMYIKKKIEKNGQQTRKRKQKVHYIALRSLVREKGKQKKKEKKSYDTGDEKGEGKKAKRGKTWF